MSYAPLSSYLSSALIVSLFSYIFKNYYITTKQNKYFLKTLCCCDEGKACERERRVPASRSPPLCISSCRKTAKRGKQKMGRGEQRECSGKILCTKVRVCVLKSSYTHRHYRIKTRNSTSDKAFPYYEFFIDRNREDTWSGREPSCFLKAAVDSETSCMGTALYSL